MKMVKAVIRPEKESEVVRGLKDKKADRQLVQFKSFCGHSRIIAVRDAILDRAADLWVAAHRDGHPRNDADLLIAATALLEAVGQRNGK